MRSHDLESIVAKRLGEARNGSFLGHPLHPLQRGQERGLPTELVVRREQRAVLMSYGPNLRSVARQFRIRANRTLADGFLRSLSPSPGVPSFLIE